MGLKLSTDHDLHSRLKSALLGVVGSFVLFAAYIAVPPLGFFFGVLAPFPAAFNRLMHGRTTSLIVLLGTTAAISAFFGLFAGVLYISMCGVIGFIMPELLLSGHCGSRVLFWTTTINVLIVMTGLVAYLAVSRINLHQLVSSEVSESIVQAVKMYEKAGVKGEELELLKRSMVVVAEMLQKLFPALVTALLIVIAGINLAILKRITINSSVQLNIGDFSTYKTPELLVWGLIASGFALLLPTSPLTIPSLNVLLIISLFYLTQGMAVVTTLIRRSSISAIVRIILYAILVIQPYLLALIAGIGLFDLWADFRTPKTQENL